MASEPNSSPFPDILSAALGESGITDGDLENLNFDAQSTSDYGSFQSHSSLDSPEGLNRNLNSSTDRGLSQADLFTQALKQLAQTNGTPAVSSTPISADGSRANQVLVSQQGPRIIKLPQNTFKLATGSSNLQTLQLGSHSIQLPANRKIITVKRIGGQPGVIKLTQIGGTSLANSQSGSPGAKKFIISSCDKIQTPQNSLINHLIRSNSAVQVVGRNGLSNGKLIASPLISQGMPASVTQTIVRSQSQSFLDKLTTNAMPILTSPSIIKSSSSIHLNGVGTSIIKTNLTNKDLSRIWSNEDIRLKSIAPSTVSQVHCRVPQQQRVNIVEEEEVEEEVEELGQAETYSEYKPSKLDIGIQHPDSVVETSSLGSVPPPDVQYRLALPDNVIDYGHLSAVQLESIVYASQRHEVILPCGERAGFLIGDGAGVGKGRTIAGLIYENYLRGRKRAIWFSVSTDLKVDAERDLKDIRAGKIDVYPLNKFKYAKISSQENGSVKKGVIFATYSSLIGESHSGGKYKTRLKQLLKWCGKEFDGVIIFDECHKAKNLCPVGSSKPTKTGQTVLELQNRLPKARIVYASATGASEPKNMAYMTRLGLWGLGTPFKEFNDFIQAVERRGVGAMELVAMDLKLRGMYIARQLSFQGVSFKIEEIPLAKDFINVYNESVQLWVDARDKFQKAAELIDAEQRMKKSMWGQFWSAHQRFFKYMCMSAKVGHCVSLARDAVKNGKCVVIGLQSTGEARTMEQLEEMGGELNDFVSTAKGVFQTLVEKHFPAPDRKKTFDIFGLGMTRNSKPQSPAVTQNGKKRKTDHSQGKKHKKQKHNASDSDSSSDSSDSDSGDIDLGIGASTGSESSDYDDFNPFGFGSDSDDDPWLKKYKRKEKKKKDMMNKKKKEKDIDKEFDKALAAAGLLQKNGTMKENVNNTNSANSNSWNTNMNDVDKAFAMKRELLDQLELIGDHLPPNTLDQLIDELGGTENVAEMTGRKGRVVCTDEGVSYESRSEIDVPLEILNLTEKQRFMDGEKNIAIISEAASSGISLQSDRRANNQRRRVHVTLELPWSADRAIQQFGRTHRSNQVNAPEYVFLISKLAGEQRFASTVAKRLESLGALTHGDRRATESRDLSRFNFDNKYGRTALEAVMKSVLMGDSPVVKPPADYEGKFFEDVKKGLVGVGLISIDERANVPILEKDYNNISKFLNRILGMEVALQNALFKFFFNTLMAIQLEAKRSGRWDMGILDLGSGSETVKKVETRTFVGDASMNIARTELTTVRVERGMSWGQALETWRRFNGPDDGFYLSAPERIGKRTVTLAIQQGANKKKEKLYLTYRPNTGMQTRHEPLEAIKKKYKKVLPNEAQLWWEDNYTASAIVCSHVYWKGSCRKASLGLPCEVGLRTRTYHVLSGSVLSVWSKVEGVLAAMPGGAHSKMQIIRLRTDEGQRIVGSLIPSNCVSALSNVLSKDCTKTYTEKYQVQQEGTTLSMPMLL